jgi:hypothetical protein
MKQKGMRYFSPLETPGPKTGRRYATVVSAIRAKRGRLTRLDFPMFDQECIGCMLYRLYRAGELKLIRRGKGAKVGAEPAIYER